MPRPNHGALGLSFLGSRALQFVCLIIAMSMTARFISIMIDNELQPPSPMVAILSIICFAILYIGITVVLYWDLQLPLLFTAGCDFLFFIALMTATIVIGKPLSYMSCKAMRSASSTDGTQRLVQSLATAAVPSPTFQALSQTANNAYVTPTPIQAATRTTISYVTQTVSNAVVAATLAPGGKTQVYGTDGQLYSVETVSRFVKRHSEEDNLKTITYTEWARSQGMSTCLMLKAVWGFGIALTVLFVFSAVTLVFVWKRERDSMRKPAGKSMEEK